jgi:ketosteroid isomerase-like protein
MEKRLVLTIGMVVCVGFSVGCQRGGLSEADRAAIRQVDATDMQMINAKDWKGDLVLYEEDAMKLPPHQAAIQGKAAIEAQDEASPPSAKVELQQQSLEIEGQGNMAYDRGTYAMTVTPAGAAPIVDKGKYLAILRKQAGGLWKFSRVIYNSDLPLPVPEKPAAPPTKTKTRPHASRRKGTRTPK